MLYTDDEDNKWMLSVPITMVVLAAMAISDTPSSVKCSILFNSNLQYWSALKEWQSGHFIKKQFEAERYSRTYTNIQDHITDCLENDPRTDGAIERLSSWAGNSYASPTPPFLNQPLIMSTSLFVQELSKGMVEE